MAQPIGRSHKPPNINSEQPTRAAMPSIANVAHFIACGVMSPSVTPRRNPLRPLRSIPFLKSKYSLPKLDAICAETANKRQSSAGNQRKEPCHIAEAHPVITPAMLTGRVRKRIASIHFFNIFACYLIPTYIRHIPSVKALCFT